jgi:hypothetical protein
MTAIFTDQPKLINILTDRKQGFMILYAAPLRNCSIHNTQHVVLHSQTVPSITVKGLKI